MQLGREAGAALASPLHTCHDSQTNSLTSTLTTASTQNKGAINPDVAIEAFTMNITTVDGYDAFKASVSLPSVSVRVMLRVSRRMKLSSGPVSERG